MTTITPIPLPTPDNGNGGIVPPYLRGDEFRILPIHPFTDTAYIPDEPITEADVTAFIEAIEEL